MATGRLTLKPFSIVTEVLYDKDRKRATGVRVLDAVTEQTTEYTARVVFVCASTLNSTWLLMQSATDVWPGGLGSSSGELGHNLMDHHFRVGAEGFLVDEALNGQYYFGNRPTGFYIPRFRNVLGDKREYLRGFGYQGSASRQGWQRAVREAGVGGDVQGSRGGAGRVADRRDGVRRDPAAPRQQGVRSTRSSTTNGACPCSRSTARPARTSARCART